MYVCKAYLWNKETLMVYNLERKQKELKCLHEYLIAMIQFQCRTSLYESTFCDKLRPRSHGTRSMWSRHLVRSVYGHIYSYHFFYDTLKLSSVILSQI